MSLDCDRLAVLAPARSSPEGRWTARPAGRRSADGDSFRRAH
jgi:hypothetical protein